MANQFQKGVVFSPGDTVEADDLNKLVDMATALPPIISDLTPVVNVFAGDVIMLLRSGALYKVDASALPSGVTSVSANATPTSVFEINVVNPTTAPVVNLGLDYQSAKTVLAGPISGATAIPAFRTLEVGDVTMPETAIAASTIDWSLSNVFSQNLTASRNFHFTNATAGQMIRVFLLQNASWTVAWTSGQNVLWPGGTAPVMTTGSGKWDMYTFHYISTRYMGTFEQNLIL